MKKSILLIMMAMAIQISLAQVSIKPTGGFGAPLFSITQIGDQTGLTIGGGGGLYINSRFFFGGFGEGTVIEHNPTEAPFEKHYFEMGSGGFWFGYSQRITAKHHINLSAQMGFGRAYLLRNAEVSYFDDISYVKPILEYEYRFNKIVGIAAGIAWPFFSDFDMPVYEAKDLSKPAASITLKFGWLQ
jgi:hypothetical protein